MVKYAIYLGSKYLSMFNSNGYGDVFKFRRNDAIGPWEKRKDAEEYLKTIKRRTQEEIKSGRWNEKEVKKNQRISRNLKVKEWGGLL